MRIPSRSFLPSNAVIELTYRCNHSCNFCSCPWYREDGDFDVLPELDTGQWKCILETLCDLGVSSFAFTGGEALLREDCMELLRYAASLRVNRTETVAGKLVGRETSPDLYLLSNGYLAHDSVLEELAGLGVMLSLSLPGLETFSRHTGYDHADLVLDRFRSAAEKGVRTTVNSTVTSLNLHELRRTLTAAFMAGAEQLLMNRFLPGGRGLANADVLALDREQVMEMLTVADDVLTRAGRKGNLGTEIPLCMVRDLELRTLRVGTRCSAALKFFVIGPSGYVRVCNHSERRLEHLFSWKELKRNDYWRTFTMRDYLPADCMDCGMKLDCDGGCREAAHIVGGSVDSNDPLLQRGRT